jgi:hypothetical protein
VVHSSGALDCQHHPGNKERVEGPNTLGVTPALSRGPSPDHRDTPTQPPSEKGEERIGAHKTLSLRNGYFLPHPRCHSHPAAPPHGVIPAKAGTSVWFGKNNRDPRFRGDDLVGVGMMVRG